MKRHSRLTFLSLQHPENTVRPMVIFRTPCKIVFRYSPGYITQKLSSNSIHTQKKPIFTPRLLSSPSRCWFSSCYHCPWSSLPPPSVDGEALGPLTCKRGHPSPALSEDPLPIRERDSGLWHVTKPLRAALNLFGGGGGQEIHIPAPKCHVRVFA